jgi:O-antigen/teichoic acid export membrane protein
LLRLAPSHADNSASTAAAVARRLLRPETRRSALAMADQGVASLGNFATNILLARALSREDYGTFGLILEGVLFFNAIQAALVTYPLSVKGATADAHHLGRYTTASLALTGAFGMIIASVTLIAGAIGGHFYLALCASAALVLWQTQETLRRAMISHLRYSQAVVGDAISYLGQGALVALLWWRGGVTLERVFLIVALTSAAGALVQIVQVKPRPVPLRRLAQHAIEFLTYGRWQALNNTTIIVTAMGYSWALAYFHGPAAVAELYAIAIILKLTNPLISGIGGLIVAAAAKVHSSRGAREAWRVASRYAWIGAAVLVPYFVMLILFPTWSIRLVHGAHSIYADRANVLRLLVAAAAITYAASTVSAYLSAVHESNRTLRAQMLNVIVSLVVGIPLMIFGGLVAGVVGLVLACAAQLAMLIRFLAKVRDRAPQAHVRLTRLIAARVADERLPWPASLRAAA